MGAYLAHPNTEKTTSNGGNESMLFGFAAMQGWRVSMEVKHSLFHSAAALWIANDIWT